MQGKPKSTMSLETIEAFLKIDLTLFRSVVVVDPFRGMHDRATDTITTGISIYPYDGGIMCLLRLCHSLQHFVHI